MCTTDVYTDVYPDGRSNKYHRPTFCHRSRNGLVCDNPVVYNHPSRNLRWDEPTSQYLYPSRPLTPRHSSTASSNHTHRSGEESDQSRGSKKNRSSGIYVNGTKVVDLSNKRRSRESRNATERIVIVDSPPTARTPPQTFAMPYTAPPSPSGYYGTAPHIVDAAPTRPLIVDERRPPIEVEVVNNESSKHRHRHHHHHSHRRNSPAHSHSRSGSNSSAAAAAAALAAEERRRYSHHASSNRAVAEAQHELRERERRRRQLQDRIQAANEEIRRRPAVPIPSAPTPPPPPMTGSGAVPVPLRRTVTTTTANMGIPRSAERDLIDAVRRLDLGPATVAARRRDDEESLERRRRQDREEDDAQKARLRERLLPRRRFTVGPGSRRHRVAYEDGMYRWE